MSFRNPQASGRGGCGVYPYRNRWRWFAFGRYSHLIRALRDRPLAVQDTILEKRLASLRGWNSLRFVVSIFISFGVLATVLGAIARILPGGLDDRLVKDAVTFSTALTTLLALAYGFLTRLLGQLEIDVLTILLVEHRK